MLHKLYNPIDCFELTAIVRYLAFLGRFEAAPYFYAERNLPDWVGGVPAIETLDGRRIVGLQEVIGFYEKSYKIDGILAKAKRLVALSPQFRCAAISHELQHLEPYDF